MKELNFQITSISKNGETVKGHIPHQWAFEKDISCPNCGHRGSWIDKLNIKLGYVLFCLGCDRFFDIEEISPDNGFTQVKDQIKAYIINESKSRRI